MSIKRIPKTDAGQPIVYQIRIEGHLGCQWADWFEGMVIKLEEDGNTLLTGPVLDQAALYGLLKKVRDLGLPLISVLHIDPTNYMSQIANQEIQQKWTKEGEKMNIHTMINEMSERRAKFSTLWVFAMFSYLYCDVMSLMDSGFLKQYMAGNVGGLQITQGFLLGAAGLMEIPITMVLLSRVLRYKANRLANIIAGSIMTVVQFATLFFGSTPPIYYIFFSILEIACTAFIVWYAWKWANPEGSPNT
jgi:uncharacterized membrane protein (DUF485 family)